MEVMMERLDQLRQRLKQLEAEITETKRRLPAHSVKPPVMMELLDLEDQYDGLRKRIARLENDSD
jgi:hypothetical protein